MAFDGVAAAGVAYELNALLTDGRVDKITQPEFDEINIIIRSKGENHRLTASASSSSPGIHLTEVQKGNPIKAPMFCMLLRKYLNGGRVVAVTQPDFERVIEIHIESKDEMGDSSVKRLIIEIMGRHSNIVLVSAEDKVLGSIKHVDFSVSAVRQLLPGMMYEYPPSQGKLNPLKTDRDEIFGMLCRADLPADKFILDSFTGIGPLTAREAAYCTFGDTSRLTAAMTDSEKQRFADNIYGMFSKIKVGMFSPCLIYDNGRLRDFSAVAITQYGEGASVPCESVNTAIDRYFAGKDKKERMQQKTAHLNKFIDNNIHRCEKKLALQQQKLNDCKNKDKYKIYGDLITANMYRIEDKAHELEAENYYDGNRLIKIPLKPELSPSKNAQRYYTMYQKCKTAEVMTAKQMELASRELSYLESVSEELARAENEADISEIREELASEGYGVNKKQGKKAAKRTAVSKPLQFELSDGFIMYIGKNNIQNDELTLKTAARSDLWFHTKNIHGCHGIIKTDGKTPSDDVIVEAAKLAAYYSKAKNSANVPVDYTAVKNVKKPRGAKPGMVIYDNYNTVNVKPENKYLPNDK